MTQRLNFAPYAIYFFTECLSIIHWISTVHPWWRFESAFCPVLKAHISYIESPVTTSLSAASGIDSRCTKCVTTKKSGKLSCCARGGSWFKKCGDAGDTQFDHTWAEGIQACKVFATSTSAKWPLHAVFNREQVILHPLNATPQRNTARVETNIYPFADMFDAGTTDSEDPFILTVLCIYIVFFIFNSQKYVLLLRTW